MFRSIKLKFTLFFTIITFVIVILFSITIYYLNVVHNDNTITQKDLMRMARFSPRVRMYLEKNKDIDSVEELASLVQHNEKEQFVDTLLMTVPPTLLVSGLLSYLIASILVRPIEDVALALNKIQIGNLSMRLPLNKSSEEIEDLIRSINLLLDRLEEAFNAQEQFIQDAAHELRTPISAMSANIDVLKRQKNLTIKDYKNALDVVEELNKKLMKLNENLLFLNRPLKKGKIKDIKVGDLLEELVEFFTIKAKEKGIKIDFDSNDDFVVKADKERLVKAFSNLLDNAIKYSDKKDSTIWVTLKKEKDKNYVVIKDEGIGIDKKDFKNIFERFFRSSSATDRNIHGEGLGLSIVKKVIDEIGGGIEVESKLNQGTTFKIIFPKIKN